MERKEDLFNNYLCFRWCGNYQIALASGEKNTVSAAMDNNDHSSLFVNRGPETFVIAP